MGYRSDVVMIFKSRDPEVFETAWVKMLLTAVANGAKNIPEVLNEFRGNITHEPDSGRWQFKADSLKWYPSYYEVIVMEYIWDYFSGLGEDPPIDGVFIRIGEEDGDIARREINNGYDLATINCSIEIT